MNRLMLPTFLYVLVLATVCCSAYSAEDSHVSIPTLKVYLKECPPEVCADGVFENYICKGNYCNDAHIPENFVCAAKRRVNRRRGWSPANKSVFDWDCVPRLPQGFPDHFSISAAELYCPEHPSEIAQRMESAANSVAGVGVGNEQRDDSKAPRSKGIFAVDDQGRLAMDRGDSELWMGSCRLTFTVTNHGPLHLKVSLVILVLSVVLFAVIMFCCVGSKWYTNEVRRHKLQKRFDHFDEERLAARSRQRMLDGESPSPTQSGFSGPTLDQILAAEAEARRLGVTAPSEVKRGLGGKTITLRGKTATVIGPAGSGCELKDDMSLSEFRRQRKIEQELNTNVRQGLSAASVTSTRPQQGGFRVGIDETYPIDGPL